MCASLLRKKQIIVPHELKIAAGAEARLLHFPPVNLYINAGNIRLKTHRSILQDTINYNLSVRKCFRNHH